MSDRDWVLEGLPLRNRVNAKYVAPWKRAMYRRLARHARLYRLMVWFDWCLIRLPQEFPLKMITPRMASDQAKTSLAYQRQNEWASRAIALMELHGARSASPAASWEARKVCAGHRTGGHLYV